MSLLWVGVSCWCVLGGTSVAISFSGCRGSPANAVSGWATLPWPFGPTMEAGRNSNHAAIVVLVGAECVRETLAVVSQGSSRRRCLTRCCKRARLGHAAPPAQQPLFVCDRSPVHPSQIFVFGVGTCGGDTTHSRYVILQIVGASSTCQLSQGRHSQHQGGDAHTLQTRPLQFCCHPGNEHLLRPCGPYGMTHRSLTPET